MTKQQIIDKIMVTKPRVTGKTASGTVTAYRLEYSDDLYVSFHIDNESGLFQAYFVVLLKNSIVDIVYSFHELLPSVKKVINHEIQLFLDSRCS